MERESNGLDACGFYKLGLSALADAKVPHLVGGGYAFTHYTGIQRPKKDLDLYVRERDLPRALEVLGSVSERTELTFPHWLGKALYGDHLIDVIHNSGNGVAPVDDAWFEFAPEETILEHRVRLTPCEEMIWSKAFVMERERCDATDVLHLLRAASALDWTRLIDRFGKNHRVLYAHLVLFGFVYPSERELIPNEVLDQLQARMSDEPADNTTQPVCKGTLLSREQFLVDVTQWGFKDARLTAESHMTKEQIAQWTRAISQEKRSDEQREIDDSAGSAG